MASQYDWNTTEVILSYGNLEDIAAIMKVMRSSFPDAYGEAWNEHQCRSMLMLPGTRLLIAFDQDDVCGFAISRFMAAEEELLMIAVHPEYRRSGVGRKIMNQVVNQSIEDNGEVLFLEVRANNNAQKLYRDMGFEEIGIRKAYYTGANKEKFDAITFKKTLQ